MINAGQNVEELTTSDSYQSITGVEFTLEDDTTIFAGNRTGYVLKATCPWVTQGLANQVMRMVKFFQYNPYEATNAIIDPRAELGDEVCIDGVYSGIFSQTINFEKLYACDIAAISDEEIEHEYPSYACKHTEEVVTKQELAATTTETATTSGGGTTTTRSGVQINGGLISAKTILGRSLRNQTIEGEQIAMKAITAEKLMDRCVTVGKIGVGAVTEDEIGTGAVTTTKVFTGAIGTQQIARKAVVTDLLGDSAVTHEKIGSGSVTTTNTDTGINATLAHADAAYDVTANSVWASTLCSTSVYCAAGCLHEGSYKLKTGSSITVDGKTYNIVTWDL